MKKYGSNAEMMKRRALTSTRWRKITDIALSSMLRASGALMPPPEALLDASHARRRVHAIDVEEEGAHGSATQRHFGVVAVCRARAVVDDLPYLSVGERDGALGAPALEAPGDMAFD